MSDNAPNLNFSQAADKLAQRRSGAPQMAERVEVTPPQARRQEAPSMVEEPHEAADDAELEEASADGYQGDVDDGDQELADADDSEAVEDGDYSEDDDDEPTFTIELDGREFEVTAEELKKGYVREQLHTKRSMALAEQRKAVEAKAEAVTQTEEATLALMANIVENLAGKPVAAPDPKLFHTDRAAYEEAQFEYDQWANRVTQWQQATQTFAAQHQQSVQQRMAERIQTEIPLLSKAWDLPGGEDHRETVNRVTGLQKFLMESYGIPQGAFGSILDHQTYLAFDDARKWRELQASGGKQARQKMKRKGIKAVRSGRANVKPQQVSASDQARKTFEQVATAAASGKARTADVFSAGAELLAARKRK